MSGVLDSGNHRIQKFRSTFIFRRGDVNGDGAVPGATADIVFLANFLFLGRSRPPCLAAADVGAGIGIFERSSERRYWDIGVTAKWRRLSFDIRYFGNMKTDLPLCQFVDWCDAAVVGKLTLASY